MARTVKIKVYQYAELSPAAKTRAREWWRSGERDDSWAECLKTDLITVAAFMGWTITGTAFSGFGSQGDGAQFSGTWNARDVQGAEALEQHAPKAGSDSSVRLAIIMADIVGLAEVAADTSASVSTHDRYCHSNATNFDSDDMSGTQLAILAEHSRALMDWYYRELEAEHDYVNSDEQVADTIIANEYEFKANGDRFTEGAKP